MTIIQNTTSFPWDDVVYITSTIGGLTFQGSGVLITPTEVLTAAHVVYVGNLGAATQVQVVPGYDDGQEPFGVYYATNFHYYQVNDTYNFSTGNSQFSSISDSALDFALIHLSAPVNSGAAGFAIGNSPVSSSGGTVNVTGYPASSGGALVNSTQFVTQQNSSNTILQGTEIGEGSSGGPVWVSGSGGTPILAGVVSAAIGATGYFAEITSTIYSQILAWLNEDSPHVAPTVNVHDVSVAANASIAASSLVTSISNPSGDSITQYVFFDAGSGGGHFTVGGVVQPSGQNIYVDLNNLINAQYVGGSSPSSETLYVSVYDYTTNSYSNFSPLTATTTAATHVVPSVSVHDVSVAAGTSIAASSLVTSVSNPSGDSITQYVFYDAGGGGGHFTVGGVVQSAGQNIYVDLSNLSNALYVGGPSPGSETLYVAVYDFTTNSYSNFNSLTATTTGTVGPRAHWVASVDIGLHPAGWLPAGGGDFNHDGTSDLLWYNSSTTDLELWKISNGKWAGSVDVGTHPAGWQPARTGDFNGDGTTDVTWYNSATRDVDLWVISNGKWAGSVDIGSHPAGWQLSGSGDFNRDGTPDLLWYNATTGDAEIWKISGGRWAGSVDVGTHPLGYQPLVSGDFNRDGTSDILWYNPTTRDIDLWKMSNGQWAGSTDIGTHPAGWAPIGSGDFTNDGTSDIVWYNSSTNDIEIWKISNGQWAASMDIGTHPAGWQPAGLGDYNHDGTADILWREVSTGRIEVWLLGYS